MNDESYMVWALPLIKNIVSIIANYDFLKGMLYYWIVEISKDFKLGKISFRKSLKNNGKGIKTTGVVETTMATKIFVECKSCPHIKKVQEYISPKHKS